MNETQDGYYIPGNLYYQFSNTNPGAIIIRTWKFVGIVKRSCSLESCCETSGHKFQLITQENDFYLESVCQFSEDTIEPFLDLDDLVKSIIAWRARFETAQFPQEKIRKNFDRSISEEDREKIISMSNRSPSSSGWLKQVVVRDSTALAGLESLTEKIDLLLLYPPSASEMNLISQNQMIEGVQFLKYFDSVDTVRSLRNSPHIKKLSIPYMNKVPEGFYDWITSLSSLEFLELNSHLVDDNLNKCLQNLPHLLSLKLKNTSVTNDIGIGLQMCHNLMELDLENTHISDGLFQFDLNCQKLDTLNLEHTCITDNSLQSIKKLKNLRSISLKSTKVTDKCIPHIKEMNQLVSLCISDTSISANGLSEIIDSLGKCTVYY